jgi:hypothetical protein
MEVINFLKNIYDFDTVKNILSNQPYNLIIKEDDDFPTLYMITYDKNSDNFEHSFINQCRGIILEKNTNKIVCYTFNKGDNIETDKNIDKKLFDKLDWNSTKVEESIDGTQIRLFYYDNQWKYATTRCIDANKARWFSNKSFYELFEEIDNIDYDKLNIKYCYSFVLCHPENRIVVNYDCPKLVHVMTRNMDTLEELDVDIGIEKPKIYDNFMSIDDIITYAMNSEDMNEGFMLRDNNYNRIKIKNNIYCKIKQLRGNTNNLFYQFLYLRCNGLLETFLSFYPEFKNKFAFYEIDIHKLAGEIHKLYISKYVKHDQIILPSHFKTMLYKLHGYYLSTREITTFGKIMQEILKLHPSQICFMYNRTFIPHHPYM